MRATYHVALLAVLAAVSVLGLTIGWSQLMARGTDARGTLPAEPTGRDPLGSSNESRPVAVASPQALLRAQSVAPTPTPLPPLPRPEQRWVQNFRPTDLFPAAEGDAQPISRAAQFTTFQLLEQRDAGRSLLLDIGKGEGALPGQVWADLRDFGPSGAPRPYFTLADRSIEQPTTGRPTPSRIASGWPRLPTAEMAIVVDGYSGGILYGKNSHLRVAPASLTKVMTAIVALERGNIRDRVAVDVDSREMTDSTVMGLVPNEVVSLETLLYGLMLPSGNDAALAIARHIGGSDQRFVELMNEKARQLGLEDTQFKNPHGLDQDGHFSTAYDLAMMSRFGMQDGTFYNLSAARHWQAEGYNLWNLNRLIGQYPGADGVKVGFTDNAGRCLIASATRDGHRVFVVVIRSEDPTADSRMLLDYAFQGFRWP